jgi:hypothetical protein
MKVLIALLLFFAPVFLAAQQSWYTNAPAEAKWQNVGIKGFSPVGAGNIGLAFSPDGVPFVAFLDIQCNKDFN